MDKNSLFTTNRQATIAAILKQVGRNEKDFKDDIETIKKWLKTQKHLPQATTQNMIEWYIIGCKFSIEKCKKKLDTYYTFKTLMPELHKGHHPREPKMEKMFDTGISLPLPQLTKNNERVVLTLLRDTSIENFWEINFATGFHFLDIRIREDICATSILVVDMSKYELSLMLKINPVTMKKIFHSFENAYAGRIAGLHFINSPSAIDAIVSLLKTVAPEKITKRIHFHKNVESLYEVVPREIMPKDYGGNAPSVDTLIDLWKEKIKDSYDLFDEIEKYEVKESLRPTPLKNDEVLGFHGNFKKLNID